MMLAKYFEYYTIILRGRFLWTCCSYSLRYDITVKGIEQKPIRTHRTQTLPGILRPFRTEPNEPKDFDNRTRT